MHALFVELPGFSRFRADYLTDEGFRALQNALMENPAAGDGIEGTGGLRKLRQADPRRGKGKRGGLRVIYFWWEAGRRFWLFTLYDKDEMDDLSAKEKKALKDMLKRELEVRRWKSGTCLPRLPRASRPWPMSAPASARCVPMRLT
jgi:hypothetical protein